MEQVNVADLPSLDRMSVSQVNMVLRCPTQWWWRYALGRKSPGSRAMFGGISLDEVVNYHNYLRLAGLPQDKYLEERFEMVYADKMDVAMAEGNLSEQDDDEYDYPTKGPLAVRAYLADADPYIQPEDAQMEQSGYFGGVPTLGYIDIEEKRGDQWMTTDLKFGKQKYEASKMLQLHVYRALGEQQGNPGRVVRACTVKKNVTPKVVFTSHVVTDQDITQAKRTFQQAWWLTRTALRQGHPGVLAMADYRDQRGPWPCSERWCGFWGKCAGSPEGVPDMDEMRIEPQGEMAW